jgi:hypothetical protein
LRNNPTRGLKKAARSSRGLLALLLHSSMSDSPQSLAKYKMIYGGMCVGAIVIIFLHWSLRPRSSIWKIVGPPSPSWIFGLSGAFRALLCTNWIGGSAEVVLPFTYSFARPTRQSLTSHRSWFFILPSHMDSWQVGSLLDPRSNGNVMHMVPGNSCTQRRGYCGGSR